MYGTCPFYGFEGLDGPISIDDWKPFCHKTNRLIPVTPEITVPVPEWCPFVDTPKGAE